MTASVWSSTAPPRRVSPVGPSLAVAFWHYHSKSKWLDSVSRGYKSAMNLGHALSSYTEYKIYAMHDNIKLTVYNKKFSKRGQNYMA